MYMFMYLRKTRDCYKLWLHNIPACLFHRMSVCAFFALPTLSVIWQYALSCHPIALYI